MLRSADKSATLCLIVFLVQVKFRSESKGVRFGYLEEFGESGRT